MKKIFIICLLCVGCAANISGWETRKAQEICADKGGIDSINTVLVNSVTCLNGHLQEIER